MKSNGMIFNNITSELELLSNVDGVFLPYEWIYETTFQGQNRPANQFIAFYIIIIFYSARYNLGSR